MSDDELPDRSGEVIAGRFKLTKRLGAGGMGEVYKALNEVVGREVAIKILRPEYARSPDVVQRVQREARAANVVRHTNIVDVLDVLDDNNGAPVIVQELLIGEDLASYMRNRGGALSEAEALDLMTPVADALGAAHAAGIMHRDLKLENVFLDRRTGTIVPKVLDFGLSRGIGENSISRLTATGVAMGTPMYMSPEHVQGQRDIDQRTDVWALGIMLYELVAGRLPFEGESLGAIFVKVCTADPPPLRTLAPDVSDGFAGVVERCLFRERTARFEHAGLLAEALRAVRSGASLNVSATTRTTLDGREQTLAASADSLGPASSPPMPLANSTLKPGGAVVPVASRPVNTQSIGPAVSVVPPAPRRNPKVVGAAAVLAFALVAALGWAAMRTSNGETSAAIVSPRATVPPVTTPAAPAAPVAAGTTQYEPRTTPPPAPPGTPAYDPPPTPAPTAPTAQPATTAYDHGSDPPEDPRAARRGRRGRGRIREAVEHVRGGRHGVPAATGNGAATTGTTEYDNN
ncbi:MAG: serine/threonine-protein kinase [Polyangiales bacterium]